MYEHRIFFISHTQNGLLADCEEINGEFDKVYQIRFDASPLTLTLGTPSKNCPVVTVLFIEISSCWMGNP